MESETIKIIQTLQEWADEPHDQVCPKDGSPCRHARATIAVHEISSAISELIGFGIVKP